MPRSESARPLLIGALIAAPAALVWMLTLRFGGLDDGPASWLSNTGLCAAAFVAAICCLLAARRRPAERLTWRLVGIGCLAWGLGNAAWLVIEQVLHQEPFPSLADAGYILMPCLVCAGLLCLANMPRTAIGRLRALVDGVMIAGAFFIGSWLLVIGDVVGSGSSSTLASIVSTFYPVSDIVIAALVLYAMLRHRQIGLRIPPTLWLLAGGLVSFAAADTGFAYQTFNETFSGASFVNLGWFAGFAVIALAALSPMSSASTPDEARAIGHLLPHAAVAGALALSIASRQFDAALAACWSVILVASMLRQWLVVRENLALTGHLEARVVERTAALAASEHRFRSLVEHSSDVVTVLDAQGVITYQSDSIQPIFGYRPEEVVGRPIVSLLDAPSVRVLNGDLGQTTREPGTIRASSVVLRNAAGESRHVEMSIRNLLDSPEVGGVVLNIRDVSDRRALEARLVYEALHDALTDLPNRSLFVDRLGHALQRAQSGSETAVLFVDLDDFKRVNDTLGHAAGDDVLITTSKRLRQCVRPHDTVARFGGDEFAILLEGAGGDFGAVAVAERICATLRSTGGLGGGVRIRASVGIALAADADDPEDLLRGADLAMYQAKSGGLGGFAIYDRRMRERLNDRVSLEADLRALVPSEQLVLHYQPILELTTGRVAGVEALVRWQHPRRGLIAPLDFMPLAEDLGLIRPIGRWVLAEACRQAGQWRRERADLAAFTMSVNLSPAELDDPDLVSQVERSLRAGGLPASCLILEITEGTLVERSDAVEVLQLLRSIGVRIAVDDFGTGYSSLSYLQRFPVDSLKIDRSFVEYMGVGPNGEADASFVAAIVQLGQSLNLTTVAEGIEEEAQLAALGLAGCQMGQGFHFSAPVRAEEIGPLLAPVSDA